MREHENAAVQILGCFASKYASEPRGAHMECVHDLRQSAQVVKTKFLHVHMHAVILFANRQFKFVGLDRDQEPPMLPHPPYDAF